MKSENIIKVLSAFLFFSLNLHAVEKGDDFKKSKEKWEKSGVKEYYIKVNYNSFSPVAGIWELRVQNGIIKNCLFNGKPAENCTETAGSFTMENLYKIAEKSSAEAVKTGSSIIKVTYGKNGLIRSVSKVNNPEYKKRRPKDTTYSIEVIDFVPGGGAL